MAPVHPEIARAVASVPDLEIRTPPARREAAISKGLFRSPMSPVSKKYLEKNKTALPAIRRFAEAWGMPVIGNKQFDDALGSATHFGALRGLNVLEAEPALAVVWSTWHLPPVEVERIAMLILARQADRAHRQLRALQMRGYRMRDGSLRGTKVDIHPDPLVQAVVEHFREGNTIQTADRLRSIHQTGKTLVLFDNVPGDVDLTRSTRRLVTMRRAARPAGRPSQGAASFPVNPS